VQTCVLLATVAGIPGGCAGRHVVTGHTVIPPSQKPVAKDASREELRDLYNQFARGVKTLNSTVELKPNAGSK